MTGIRDRDSLLAWLQSLPRYTEEEQVKAYQIAVFIAHNLAMRMLPLIWQFSVIPHPVNISKTVMSTLRSALVSGVAVQNSATEVKNAAKLAVQNYRTIINEEASLDFDGTIEQHIADISANAAIAVYDDLGYVAASIEPALMSAQMFGGMRNTARQDVDGILASIRHDCSLSALKSELGHTKLWPYKDVYGGVWQELRPLLLQKDPNWAFWVEWYDKALNGAKQDIPLLTKVALIDPADWDKGAGHVNALIAQIVQDHTRKPEPPRPTDVERSHIALILAAPEPAWQSAEFLRERFDRIATAYIREIGCPNTDPPEIEPIRILSQTFDQMAHLLRSLKDRDQKIAELTQKLEVLEATNMKLVAIAQGQHSSRLNRIFDGAMGAVSAHMIIATFTQLGGPSVADGVSALWELINPSKPPSPPVSVLPPKIFET